MDLRAGRGDGAACSPARLRGGALTTGKLRIVTPDGAASDAELVTGAPYAREAGVAHDVINRNAFEFSFIEIEVK
jgi:hypothetical protein